MLAEVRGRLAPLVSSLTKATLDFIYSEITGQATPTDHGAADRDARARLRALVATGDADIVVDLRKLNGSDGKCFDLFWDTAEGMIEDLLKPQVGAARGRVVIFFGFICL